jgi:hypothetical protein
MDARQRARTRERVRSFISSARNDLDGDASRTALAVQRLADAVDALADVSEEQDACIAELAGHLR